MRRHSSTNSRSTGRSRSRRRRTVRVVVSSSSFPRFTPMILLVLFRIAKVLHLAQVEVLPPCRDLVSHDLHDAHDRKLATPALGRDDIPALHQHHVAGDNDVPEAKV